MIIAEIILIAIFYFGALAKNVFLAVAQAPYKTQGTRYFFLTAFLP